MKYIKGTDAGVKNCIFLFYFEKIIMRLRKREQITDRRFESRRAGNLAKSASGAHVSKKRIETITFGVIFNML